MSFAMDAGEGRHAGPAGYTYAVLAVRNAPDGDPPDVVRTLTELRFSGWVGTPGDGWTAAVAAAGDGTVATGRRGVMDVAAELGRRLGVTVVGIRVLRDRQLVLGVWSGPDEVGRYVSDPSVGLPADDDTLPDPMGEEHAEAFADVCGRPEAGAKLAELLAEEYDEDSVIESERLAAVLALLGLPRWLNASASLPKDVPAGPRARDLTRLRAGATGPRGILLGALLEPVRARRRPPPAFTGAPRGMQGIEPWML